MYIYIYIYMYVFIYTYIYIIISLYTCIYIERERGCVGGGVVLGRMSIAPNYNMSNRIIQSANQKILYQSTLKDT